MSEPIVIIGCGGLGREVWSVIAAINESTKDCWEPIGFVDDTPSEPNLQRLKSLDAPFLGAIEKLGELAADTYYIIGIGDPRVRERVDLRAKKFGLNAARLVHPSATVGLDVRIGRGSVLFPGAAVTTNIKLGRHVHLNQNVSIGHDVVLEDFVTVNPLAAVSGDCHVGRGVMIGTTAAVLQGLRIGPGATVGASACVVRDVDADTVVKGVPAR